MTNNINSAITAYQNAVKGFDNQVKDSRSLTGSSGGSGQGSFADAMANYVQDSINTVSSAETVSAMALKGEASSVELVTSITEAQMLVDTVVAVRNRLVTSIKEVLQMPI